MFFKWIVCFPARLSSFPDRKSLQGLSPHHRWPFNTSLATANEPGAAAAWLDQADFAQMFVSHVPAVLGWEVHLDRDSILPHLLISTCLSPGADSLKDPAVAHFCDFSFPHPLAERTPFEHGFGRNLCSVDERMLVFIIFEVQGKELIFRNSLFSPPRRNL